MWLNWRQLKHKTLGVATVIYPLENWSFEKPGLKSQREGVQRYEEGEENIGVPGVSLLQHLLGLFSLKPVVLRPEHTLESPGEFIKTRLLGPTKTIWLSRAGGGLEFTLMILGNVDVAGVGTSFWEMVLGDWWQKLVFNWPYYPWWALPHTWAGCGWVTPRDSSRCETYMLEAEEQQATRRPGGGPSRENSDHLGQVEDKHSSGMFYD